MAFCQGLSCIVAVVGGDAFLGDVKPPRLGYFMECCPSVYLVLEAPKHGYRELGGPQSRLRGWAIIDVPRYRGYKTLIIALESFIERVAEAVHSTRGRIGTHMLLWVLS
jgi:hypothetical protein